MLRHPIQSILPPWSWKAAAFTALFRGTTFFVKNLQSGERVALHAMPLEACYAIVAAGLAGAVSQQLRKAEPLMPTLTVVLIALPAFFVGGQLLVHKVAHTPHLASGLLVAFLLTSFSSGFSCFAMRQGALLGGVDATTLLQDGTPPNCQGFSLCRPTSARSYSPQR